MTTKRKNYDKTQLPGKPENMRVIDYLRKNFSHEGFEWQFRDYYPVKCWLLKRKDHPVFPIELYSGERWYFTTPRSLNEDGTRLHIGFIPNLFNEMIKEEFQKYEQEEVEKHFEKLDEEIKNITKQGNLVRVTGLESVFAETKVATEKKEGTRKHPPVPTITPSVYPVPVITREQSKTRKVLMNFWTNVKLFWMNIQGHLQ